MKTPTPDDRDIGRLLTLAQDDIKVDRSAKAHARAAMQSAYAQLASGDNGVPASVTNRSDVGLTEVARLPSSRRDRSRWSVAAVAATAIALLIVGLTLATRRTDQLPSTMPPERMLTPPERTTPGSTIEPRHVDGVATTAAAEAIGMQFMRARADHDSAALIALMASDVSFGLTEPAQSLAEVPLQTEWERAVDWQFLQPSCRSDEATTVVCGYTVQGAVNERLGLGPYEGNAFHLQISDGLIQRVSHNLAAFDFFTDIEVQFYGWLRENHPDDFSLMLEGDRLLGGDYPSFPRLTPESVRLWDERTTEYLATLN